MSDEREAVSGIVFDKLRLALPRYTRLSQWLEGHTEEQIFAAQDKAEKLLQWACAQPHSLSRSEYIGWIRDYYLVGYREALSELKYGATKREHEDRDAASARVLALENRLRETVPTPPR